MILLDKIFKRSAVDPNKLVAKKPDQDFIPYVCHYDPTTILTKNGELLQVIRITGFNNDSIISEMISLRDAVRDSITDNVKDNKVAFWFNTIRRRKNIKPKGEFSEFFAKKVDEVWDAENSWSDQYVNELYVTVIVEGLDTSIVNVNAFLRSFSYFTTRSLHHKHLENAHQKLTSLVSNIMLDIEEYGARLLGIKEWQGVLYSEPMRFFGKIINLYEERYPLSANDISEELTSHKVAFGDRELEVLGYNNKNFAAMLSLKEYQEVPIEALDRILQLPFEFIITQSFDFSFSRKDLAHFEYQDYIAKVSGDEDFRVFSGIANFMESNTGKATDYGKLQTTIMFISKSVDQLEKDIKKATEKFTSLGYVIVREDVFAEHCFWSQLPANFSFLRRQKLINTLRIGGFAALHNFPTGLIDGNKWGPAVTVVKTILNTPYFFNFHDGDCGHTLILGPKGSGKAVMVNFLLAQTRKIKSRLLYIDLNSDSYCFVKALGGKHYEIYSQDENSDIIQMSPLTWTLNDQHRQFLIEWFGSFAEFANPPVPKEEIDFIPNIVDHLIAEKIDDFAAAVEVFNVIETKELYEKLKIWTDKNLAHVFSARTVIDLSNVVTAFNFVNIANTKHIMVPIIKYLLYRIEATLDGAPAIIVMNEVWNLIDNPVIAPHIKDFLVRMKEKNCVVIFVSQDIESLNSPDLIASIRNNIVNEIYLPNSNPGESYKSIMGLTDEEFEIIKAMDIGERHFLLKHRGDSVIATLNLSGFKELLKVFSSDEVTITAMQEVIAAATKNGNKPRIEVWFDQFLEVLRHIEEDRRKEEVKKFRENVKAEKERKAKLEE